MAYLDVGRGKPVILIHGFGGSMWHWENQYLPLAQTHRVLIPDLLGSGLSDKPEATYSPEQLVKFFLEFMNSLEIETGHTYRKLHGCRASHGYGSRLSRPG